jgi:hypothetical protein
MMNLVSRDDLANMGDMYGSGDEGSESRAKIWLFLSYCIAFGSVAGRCGAMHAKLLHTHFKCGTL